MRNSRKAFTLLEVVLATTISASIAGVCLGLFVFFDRTDARLQDRFQQNSELARLYLVQQRAFGKLLLSDKPRSLKEAELRLRNPGDAKDAAPGANDEPPTNPEDIPTRGKRQDVRNHPQIIAIREQIPPRLELSLREDATVEAPEMREAIPGYAAIRAQRFTTTPQRLELVLTESPVPSKSALDDPEALMERVAKQRARERQQLRRMRASDDADPNQSGASGALGTGGEGEDDAEDFDFETPMRAVRGAFELRPMVPVGADVSSQARGWEVWWVPLPREAGPDEEPEDDVAPILDEPYLVATGIAFIEWKVFQGRERRNQYVGRLNDDIPAYIEVEVETIGGLRANWLFEVDWTFGNESRPIVPPTPVGSSPSTPTVPGTPGAPGAPGQPESPTPTQPSPSQPTLTPIQKPGQRPSPEGSKPMETIRPDGTMRPATNPARKRKEGLQ